MLPPLLGCRLPAVTVAFLSIRFPPVFVDILPFQGLLPVPAGAASLQKEAASFHGYLWTPRSCGREWYGCAGTSSCFFYRHCWKKIIKKKIERLHLQRKGAPLHHSVRIRSVGSPVSIEAASLQAPPVPAKARRSSPAVVPPIRQGALRCAGQQGAAAVA